MLDNWAPENTGEINYVTRSVVAKRNAIVKRRDNKWYCNRC